MPTLHTKLNSAILQICLSLINRNLIFFQIYDTFFLYFFCVLIFEYKVILTQYIKSNIITGNILFEID